MAVEITGAINPVFGRDTVVRDASQGRREAPHESKKPESAAGQGTERANHALDVRELDAMLVEDLNPITHELVVIGLVAGRSPKLGDARLLAGR